ncbi:MAG: serine--tRNA ligase [Alphaproteobacteria bacterium]|nr:serine--tRNA ligase [Alphaproteobacteria bacterium]
MFDIKFIRDHPDQFDAGLARRGVAPQAKAILDLDKAARKLTETLNDLQSRRNAASKEIGAAKAKGDDAAFNALRAEVDAIKKEMPAVEAEQKEKQGAIRTLLSGLPNIPADDVPDGADEAANVEIRKVGEPRQIKDAKEHFDIGEALGQMDFETAAKMSGARFVLLKGQLARLERAIASFMLDLHTGEYGYTECQPPLLVHKEALFGTGQLPKFKEDLFESTTRIDLPVDEYQINEGKVELINIKDKDRYTYFSNLLKDSKWTYERIVRMDGSEKCLRFEKKYWLIPTAEVPLTNIVNGEILAEEELPLRFTAWTPCFRSEAGSAGRDTRGMIRLHQFSKVELVSITAPEQSDAEHERMTACAEEVLKRLDLSFRTMVLCTGDMGFGARKTYDIEVWLPGQNAYREISSCSNCGDFQARRMNTRCRPKGEKQTRFVHTLNGSALAVGRTMVAILENYQQADGSVAVPDVLQPYMGGLKKIEAAK